MFFCKPFICGDRHHDLEKEVIKEYGATDILNYKNGTIDEQVMKSTNGKGVDKVIVAGGDIDTFI